MLLWHNIQKQSPKGLLLSKARDRRLRLNTNMVGKDLFLSLSDLLFPILALLTVVVVVVVICHSPRRC